MATNVDLEALRVQVEGLDIEENKAGSGAYGVVFRVTVNGRNCIAKKLHNILLQADNYYPDATTQQREFIVDKFRNECRILSELKHDHVVGFVGVHYGKDRNDISLIMERLHTDLAAFVKDNPQTVLSCRVHILYDVSKGLHYLHTLHPPLVHRDLTAFNILLTEDLTAKIGDLGVSRYVDPSMVDLKLSVNPGHLVHMPPESQRKVPKYTTNLDIFSFGNLILHTINGKLPKVCTMYALTLERANALEPEGKVELMRRSDAIEEMGEQHCLHSLVVRCLHDRPEERPAIEEVSTSLRELCGRYPRESFLDACKNGNIESVSIHLENGADPNQVDENGIAALHWVCIEGHDEVVRRLIEAKVDVNIQDKSGQSPLYVASHEGHQTVVERLIAAGANVNVQTKSGESPLWTASFYGHIAVVERLIAAGANVNVQKEDGATALYVAAQEGHLRVVEGLLGANADVNIKANNLTTALQMASQRGHDETVRVLLAAKATVNTQNKSGVTPLWTASFNGHIAVVERLIAAGANVNVQKEDGTTALYVAAQEGHLRVVKSLLGANADVNIKANNLRTALHWPSTRGHTEVVRVLLAARATVNTQDQWGYTSLHKAAENGHLRVVELLLEANADVTIKTNNGETAYDLAKEKGHDLVCKKLTKSKQCAVM